MKLHSRQIQKAIELDIDVENDLENDRLDREHLESYGDDWQSELEPNDDSDMDWEYEDPWFNDDYDYSDDPWY